MASFTAELDKVQGWQLPFHMVTGAQITDEGAFLEFWKKVRNKGVRAGMEDQAAADVKRYVDNYAKSQALELQDPLSSFIVRVVLRAIGDETNPELVFHVVPKEGLTGEQTENLGNALFPLSYT